MKKFLGARLKILRGSISQTKTAAIFNVPQQTYSGWETGSGSPDITQIVGICTHYGVTADWLLGLSRDQSPPALSVAESPDPSYACPNCAALKAQVDKLLDTLHNLSMGRSHPARTAFSGPVKY